MNLFDTDRQLRWLICLTHPDDEIGICAWVKRLTENGNEVHLSWTHSTLVRTEEAKNVAKQLGVPEQNLHFFGAPDGQVVEIIPDLIPSFRKLMVDVKPDRVVCAAFEQGHIDHDATNFIVSKTANVPIFEYPLYHTYISRVQAVNRFADPTGEELLTLSPEEQRLKRWVIRQYPSQKIKTILFWYELYHSLTMRPQTLVNYERLRLHTHEDFTKPNLPPLLARRVQSSQIWHRWVKVISQLEPVKLG